MTDFETPKEVYKEYGIAEVLARWVMDGDAEDFISNYINELLEKAEFWKTNYYVKESLTLKQQEKIENLHKQINFSVINSGEIKFPKWE
ncbi:hypothetical protein V7128_02025 [Neobacillus vireti]|uniref:hypothetical protein n=1 Tax=Neobacillus vireti TaxID=220686 RepID=UPI002FFF0CE0